MAHEWENPEKAAVRDNLVQAVFPGDGGYLVGPLPDVDQGLAAASWEDRLPFVENFQVLVSSWHGEVAEELKGETVLAGVKRNGLKGLRRDIEHIERTVVTYYCQTFYNYFGHAAICFHRLPPP
jgi:hypothetical protein